MTTKTKRNAIGRQIANRVDEAAFAISVAVGSFTGGEFIILSDFTKNELLSLFGKLPTANGNFFLDVSGIPDLTLSDPEIAPALSKGYQFISLPG